MSTSATVRTAWRDQAFWSATASRLKRDLARTRTVTLGLVIAAAVLGALAASLAALGGGYAALARGAGAAAAVATATAAFLNGRKRPEEHIRRWTRARSASEALKEQVYRYATSTGRYAGPDRDERLNQVVSKIVADVDDLQAVAPTLSLPERDPPASMSLADYVARRLRSQIDGYYHPQVETLARRRDRLRAAQFVLLLAATVLGALVSFFSATSLAGWLAVLTTVAAALATHIEASRFDHLITGYQATARRLQALCDEWDDRLSKAPLTPEEAAQFVDRCEDAISVENQAWMAGWTKQ